MSAAAIVESFLSYAAVKLPELIAKHAGDERAAIAELGETWHEHRAHEMQDRREEIARNEAEVDAILKERGS